MAKRMTATQREWLKRVLTWYLARPYSKRIAVLAQALHGNAAATTAALKFACSAGRWTADLGTYEAFAAKQPSALEKRLARQQATLAKQGARKCVRCGEYGNVEHDHEHSRCNRCDDAIQAGADSYDPTNDHIFLTGFHY